MRKFLGFLVLLLILFLVGSFFMPTRFVVKQEVFIANNKAVVYNKMQDIGALKDWLQEIRKKQVTQNRSSIYWEEHGEVYDCKIEKKESLKEVVLLAQDIHSKHSFTATYNLEELGEKLSRVSLEVISSATLNPITRYYYGFKKRKLERIFESMLVHLKKVSEAVHYERFHLSTPKVTHKKDVVFSLARKANLLSLSRSKQQGVDSLLESRLYRYRVLDTTSSSYVQYTDWADSTVAYNFCIPLYKKPTKKQLLWLQGGEVDLVEGKFFTSTYEGATQDLPLAWDSLYTLLVKKGLVAEGLPLEQFLSKTDSTEQRKLFIRFH